MSSSHDRPNILWLTYEDTSPQFVSCYGMTSTVTSPRIDELAATGVRFDSAFATAPVCSASRSALITGVCNEATGLGHHRSRYRIPRDLIQGFPRYLQNAGYYTTNNAKTDYNIMDEEGFIRDTWDESSGRAHWRNRDDGRPFFSVFNFMDSHQSRTMTKPWKWYEEQVLGKLPTDQVITPDQIIVPPIYRDTPEMRRHLSRVHNSVRLCDLRIGERLDELSADNLMHDTIIFCFADHGEGIPRGKCNAIGFGYRAAFVAWFPPKYQHLNPWGSGTVTSELVSFEDLAPTMLSLAGVEPLSHMTGRPLAGPYRRERPDCIFAARNRLDDTPDLARSAMDGRFVYTRNYFPHLPVVKYQKYSDVADILRIIREDYRQGALNDVQQELVMPTRPFEYLFDLDADPWEVNNLAGDPRYEEDLRRLRQATLDRARAVGDVMFLPETAMVARAGGAPPYALRYDARYNPLGALLATADLVGSPDAIPRQLSLLGHSDGAVRYWAAVGLFAAIRFRLAGEPGWAEVAGPDPVVLRNFLDDHDQAVRVEIAGALVGASAIGGPVDEVAVDTLRAAIESDDPLIAHQAVQKVLYLPAVAPMFGEAVTVAAERLVGLNPEPGSLLFPIIQSVDMYRYLYENRPLYYEEDMRYLDPRQLQS